MKTLKKISILLIFISIIILSKKSLATTYFSIILSSALKSLTSRFGMGLGVPSLLSSLMK